MKFYLDKNNIIITELDNIFFPSEKYSKNYSYNPVSNISSWIITEVEPLTPIKLENIWTIIPSKKYGTVYFYNTVTKKSQWNLPQLDNCTGRLAWTGNSCFIDSVLQSLFMVPTDFTNMLLTTPVQNSSDCDIKGIQSELNRIVLTIRNITDEKVPNVTKLRKLLRTCPDQEELWNTDFHDAGEFLQYLLDLFPNTNAATKQITTYGTNNLDEEDDKILTSVTTDTKASVVVTIDPFTLLEFDEPVSTQELITITHDSGELEEPLIPDEGEGVGEEFIRQISETIIVDSPIIILNILRNNPIDESVITTDIIPYEQITLQSGKIFNLSAIVVFRDQHYVCYYKCNTKWHFYNDMSKSSIVKFDKFEDIFETEFNEESEVKTRGTLYFYVDTITYI